MMFGARYFENGNCDPIFFFINLYPTNVPVREHQFLSGPGLH